MTRFPPGSIVSLRQTSGDSWDRNRIEYVFVLSQPEPPFNALHPEVRIAPVSFAVEFAADLDLKCDATEGGLPLPFLVELWNQRAILVEELEPHEVGHVSATTLANAYAVHNAMVGEVDGTEARCAAVGREIELATDPRVEYQERRADLAEALSRRADTLLAPAPRVRAASTYRVEIKLVEWAADPGVLILKQWPMVAHARAGAVSPTPAAASHHVLDYLALSYTARELGVGASYARQDRRPGQGRRESDITPAEAFNQFETANRTLSWSTVADGDSAYDSVSITSAYRLQTA